MHADRSHVHHRLIDMGLSQKQTVAVLYMISAILGVCAVVLTTSGALKALFLLLALCAAGLVAAFIFLSNNEKEESNEKDKTNDTVEPGKADAAKDAEVQPVSEEDPNGTD
jgi:UDP-GlcNAc:undecaprenyl-phosphate GlcNAc-1-phosphate transferase